MLLPGTKLGRFTLLVRLAAGGMAEIFLARLDGAAGFRKHLVLKLILPELAEDERFVRMFLEEARVASRISHPNVCPVYELGEADGRYFIAMDYLEGAPLSSLMSKPPPLPVRLAATLLAQACEGLHHAHELRDLEGQPAGVIHRDVSPTNLFVTTDGTLKLLDFGVAKARDASIHSGSGSLKGKYAYMAPEQVLGQPMDRRADLFALGVVGFEMLSGRRLFRRDNEFATFKAITEEEIPQLAPLRPDAPPQLCAAVMRAVERDPERRFANARAMAEAITECVTPVATSEIAAELEKRLGAEIAARREAIARAIEAAPTSHETPTVAARPRRAKAAAGRLWIGVSLGGTAVAAVALTLARSRAVPSPEPIARPSIDAHVSPPDAAPVAIVPPAPTHTPVRRRPVANSSGAGYFTIDSQPYATIYVDGMSIGNTPIFRRELPAGRHTVRAVSKLGKIRTFSVQIESGQEAPARRLVW